MRQKPGPEKAPAEQVVKDIRRATRRHFSAEEKIRIVLEGLRGEESIAELCRREGIASSMYYGWSKEFLEAGKKRLAGDTARAATSDEVKDLRREAQALKEVVADLTLENRLLKKSMTGDGGRRGMRYPASEKAEIIRLVEGSPLSTRETLQKLGIPRATFYRWYDLCRDGGPEALADRRSRPGRIWNRIPREVPRQIIDLALDQPDLSPRELAVRFTDENKHFVSEASVYRLLNANDLITSPAYIVIKEAEEFRDKTTTPNQLWQTDFTYLKIVGWGWYYLSTVLDDFSRFIMAWKLCATMRADDVTATLDLALAASGLDHVTVVHRPRLLSDNGASYISADLAEWLEAKGMSHIRGTPYHRQTQGKIERWHQTLKNRILLNNDYLPGDLEAQVTAFFEHYNHRRIHESLGNLTPPTSTSDAAKPFSSNAKGSSAISSRTVACSTTLQPHSVQPQMSQSLHSKSRPACLECSDDGHAVDRSVTSPIRNLLIFSTTASSAADAQPSPSGSPVRAEPVPQRLQ